MLIVVGKAALTAFTVFVMPQPVHTALILAAGRSQIGEFSFIIGQAGIGLGLLSADNYSLILAGAIVSITVNTAMFHLVTPVEQWLQGFPGVWRVLNRHGVDVPTRPSSLRDHVVIIGSGRVGRHIASMLERKGIPRLVVETNPSVMAKLQALKIPVLYGDAANSEVLRHANLSHARALVITVPDDSAALAMVGTALDCAPNLPILARASSWDAAQRLRHAGVRTIVRPELEGGVELLRQTLLGLEFSDDESRALADDVRHAEL